MSIELSRLEEVELNEIWETEPKHFTPWLAEEENLILLSRTLGLELELEAKEIPVGDMKADILCKNEDGSRVLIENQLERTDHKHLGQIITYSAGLDAHTVIWVAKQFRKEHRAAIDQLNEITKEPYSYFAIEIKVWKIGSSAYAPQFNVVSSPNDWSETVVQDTQRQISKNLTDTQRLQELFWTEFRKYLTVNDSNLNMPQPQPQARIVFSIGKSDFSIYAIINFREKKLRIQLTLLGENSKAYFHLLMKQKENIECELTENLEWSERPEDIESQIYLVKHNIDFNEKESWQEAYRWLHQQLELFYKVFKPLIINLDVADWSPED